MTKRKWGGGGGGGEGGRRAQAVTYRHDRRSQIPGLSSIY